MNHDVTLLVDIRAQVGEGAIWEAQKKVLYWLDILSSELYEYNPTTGENKTYHVGQHVGTVVPRASGGLMLALYNGFAAFDPADGKITMIADPEANLPANRFNDGKCDPAGRFWAGTMAYTHQSTQGSLYRLDADLSVHKMMGNIAISNGIVWTADKKTMYYIDTHAYNVRAYDYDNATGNIANERVVVTVEKGMGGPDGMAIDADDMLWVAHYGGSCVRRWDPKSGKVLDQIDLPVSNITSCAFGGDDLSTLYITSAAQQLSAEALAKTPLAGSLFRANPGVKGVPSFAFAG